MAKKYTVEYQQLHKRNWPGGGPAGPSSAVYSAENEAEAMKQFKEHMRENRTAHAFKSIKEHESLPAYPTNPAHYGR